MATPTQPITQEDLRSDLNRVVLTGRLTEPPELHDLDEQTSVCFLKVECREHKRPDLLGDELPLTVSVLLLGRGPKKMAPYLYKGRSVVVEGSLASAEWEVSGSAVEETVCVLGERVEFLGEGPARRMVWPVEKGRRDRECAPMVGFSEDVWF